MLATESLEKTTNERLHREGVSEAQALLGNTKDLSFNVDRFVAEHFHVDRFVAECKDRVSLHTLREDLETHYKSIRVALIDLINQDYADFVDLSSNLVGMEKSIEHLRQPLGQLREEVGNSKKGLNEELNLIKTKLSRRKDVREKKTKLQNLINVVNSVEKIEKILFAKPESLEIGIFMEGKKESMGQFLERVAGEFNQLQFHVNQSKGHPIVDNIKSRVSLITSKLQESLETSFKEGIAAGHSDLVLRCLRTYALIDKTGHAEDLFRHHFVIPKMEKLVNEKFYNTHGLISICDNVLMFVKSDCQVLLKLTTEANKSALRNGKEDFVKGFDFIVNAVWPEVDIAFETRLPFIFSPGNPDLFLERYSIVMSFLEDFEICCTSLESFQRLRSHSSYDAFMSKWSFPVYFRIRLQEIGGQVEAAINTPLEKSDKAAINTALEKRDEELQNTFSTNLAANVWNALNRCWDDKVYIQPLFSRFWRLYLQILNRLAIVLKGILANVQPTNKIDGEVDENVAADSKPNSIYNIVDLGSFVGDVYKINSKASALFKSKVEPKLKALCESTDQHEASFNESIEEVSRYLKGLTNHFIKSLSEEASLQFENTKNIPRLYRRTNRDPPSQASAYVTLAFSPLKSFCEDVSGSLDEESIRFISQETVFVMTTRYNTIVEELVASIKKTEESLQRLKRIRKGVDTNIQALSSNEISDESKIRRQLFLDVEQFGKEASILTNLPMENHKQYKQLLELVINADKSNQ